MKSLKLWVHKIGFSFLLICLIQCKEAIRIYVYIMKNRGGCLVKKVMGY